MTSSSSHEDLRSLAPASAAETRLVIFPHAGAGPSSYAAWTSWLPTDCHVVVAQLPGREDRYREPPVDSLKTFAATVAARLDRPDPDSGRPVPLVLFGHSMGAILAAETAKTLAARGSPVDHVVVSGCRPPEEASLAVPLHNEPIESLAIMLASLRDNDPVMLEPAFRKYWEPIIRADLRLCHQYVATPPPFFSSSLTAIAAHEDLRAGPVLMKGWRRYTTGAFELVHVPGGHFSLFTRASEVFRRVLLDVLAGAHPAGVDDCTGRLAAKERDR